MQRIVSCFLAIALVFPAAPRVRAAEQKRIALTFDDGPNGKVTERILEILEREQVPATFFVCGTQAEKYPRLLARMVREGHEVGLHSYCHCYMDGLREDEIYDDFASCFCAVSEACGIRPKLFRPPGGRCSQTLLRCAEQENLAVILWSIDTLDWNKAENSRSLARITQKAADGQIILMHDLLKTSCSIAEQAIAYLKSEGYTFCTVSELLGAELQSGRAFFAVDEPKKNA